MDNQFPRLVEAATAIKGIYDDLTDRELVGILSESWGQVQNMVRGRQGGTTKGFTVSTHTENKVLICIAGVFNNRSANSVALGYAHRDQMLRSGGANTTMFRDAADILNLGVLDPIVGSNTDFYLIGHSAGGAVAEILAGILARRRREDVSVIATFGSPKPGESGVCWEGRDVDRFRYMNFNDPVPVVPNANLSRSNQLFFALPLYDAQPYRCVHGSGGIGMYPTEFRACQDAIGDGSLSAQLDRWANNDPMAVQAHSINSYIQRLSQEIPREGAVPRLVMELNWRPPQHPAEPNYVMPFPLPFSAATAPPVPVVESRGATFNVVRGPSGSLTRRVGGGMAQSKITKGMRFVYQRHGDQWNVFLQNFMCAQTSSASAAKTLCGAGNKFLRCMGGGRTIFAPTMGNAIVSWVNLAGTAGNGVTPPLNVQAGPT